VQGLGVARCVIVGDVVTGAQVRAATAAKPPMPVLAVSGQYGHPEVGAKMELVATDVAGITIPNCGHLCAEEKPAGLVEAIPLFPARAFAA
jgi:pimeloyl-ACP methyl ester carboxylesterase